MPDRVTILKGPIIKVLLPTRLRWFNGHSSGTERCTTPAMPGASVLTGSGYC